MKKLSITIVTLAFLAGGTGCKKLLDKEPLSVSVEENFYRTDQDLISGINAAYSDLQYEGDGGIYVPLWAYGDIVSDDSRKGSNSETDIAYWNRNEQFISTADDPGLAQVWQQQYLGIRRANIVIEKAPAAANASAAVKNRVVGEAKFLRAYYHFYLLRMFGMNQGIPLVTKTLAQGEFEQPRTSKGEVFAQIEKDLTEAAAALPEKGGAGAEVGRATKGSALGLLTRVYLFDNKMPDVLATAQQIISSKKYDLLPIKTAADVDSAFASIFREPNENSVESLFEIQFQSQSNNNWFGTTGTITQVMTRGRSNSGWGFNVPTLSLFNEYETNDPRREGTILKNGDFIFAGEVFIAPSEETYPYLPFAVRKFIEPKKNIAANQSDNTTNYIILRYADILLMAAEAANATGNDALAQEYLNQVRTRATMPAVAASGAALKDKIWHERRVELAMEGLRFFDLVRQGRAGQVMRATGDAKFPEGKLFREGVSEVFPIPQSEIALSQGKLTQNNGY